jgi:hypothetical protein
MQIENSHRLREDLFSEADRTIWLAFPEGLRRFLHEHNGGIIDPAEAEFDIPIARDADGIRTYGASNSLDELWAFLSYENEERPKDRPRSILHEHFDRHVDEQFLPSRVYVIGSCVQNSLLCISTNEHDFGTVYYWEWYWQYPWYQQFFEERIEEVESRFARGETETAQSQERTDALNYATLVAVAPSFEMFLGTLHPERDHDDGDDE